jgi:hypothetical protein
MQELTLTWGPKESLTFHAGEDCIQARLTLRSADNHEQNVYFILTTSIDQIEAAWKNQGEQWQEPYTFNSGPPLVAIRFIWLPDGNAILWNVQRFNNRTFDNCGVVRMRKADWIFGQIRAVGGALVPQPLS